MRFSFLIVILIWGPGLLSQTDGNGTVKNGYLKKYDEKTGKLVYEGEFKNDIPSGKFKYYYPNDSLRAILYFRNEGKIATAKLFHPTGKKMADGKYINKETKDSTWNYYDELGKIISKEKYVNGKKEGISLVYLPDGSISEEKNFKSGVEEGEFKEYFDGKKIKVKGTYLHGNYNGKYAYYYPSGVEVAVGYYVNGNKNGPWIYKSPDGTIKDRELYRNGKQCTKKETEEFFSRSKAKAPASEKKDPKNPPQKKAAK